MLFGKDLRPLELACGEPLFDTNSKDLNQHEVSFTTDEVFNDSN